MAWGISEKAPQREKIFARYADDIQGLNSTGTVDYRLYSYLWDIGRELADKSYKQGKKDAVVHAHWIDLDEDDWGYVYECSACEEWFILETGTPESNGYSYCPNCGAKMDVEEQHEQ